MHGAQNVSMTYATSSWAAHKGGVFVANASKHRIYQINPDLSEVMPAAAHASVNAIVTEIHANLKMFFFVKKK